MGIGEGKADVRKRAPSLVVGERRADFMRLTLVSRIRLT